MKKIISLFICVIVLVSTLSIPTSVSANKYYTVGDYEFTITDKQATITRYIGTDTKIEIPSEIKGYPVISVGNSAFWWEEAITNIIIPNSVTSIGERAFYHCSSLNSITLSDDISYIAKEAFLDTAYYKDNSNWENGVLYINNHLVKANDEFMTEYSVKEGTKTIASNAFEDSDLLETVIIPNSLCHIGDRAFYSCDSLTDVTLGDSVISIGYYAFLGCNSLKTITIPATTTSIGAASLGPAIIVGYSGSCAHEYAIEWGKDFVSIGCYKHSCNWETANKPKCLKEYKCEYCSKVLEKKYKHSYKWKTTRKSTIFQRGIKKYKCVYCGKVAKTKYIAKKKVNKPKLKFYKRSETLKASWTRYSGKETVYVRYRKTNSKKWTTKKWKTFELDDLKPGKNYYIQARLKVTKNGKVAKSGWSNRIKIKLVSNYNSSSGSSSNNSSGNPSTSYGVYITPYGSKYHFSKSCAGSNAIETTLESARSSHDPCKKCAQ